MFFDKLVSEIYLNLYILISKYIICRKGHGITLIKIVIYKLI